MKPIVVDASMAACWIIDEEKSKPGNKILEEIKRTMPIAPTLFWYEMRNILLINERRGKIPKNSALPLFQSMHGFGIKERRTSHDDLIFSLAREHNLSAYDAAYLALAITSDAILASNDRKLAQAALHAGVELRTILDMAAV